ncbi:exonuclease SbcD [Pseudoalteromonas citrea]|uniref:Nuclease SbcCD subunit D n=2 Tax=Pseudoalteromonas citrea TaxID=43655 RepID=A0AAD4AF41_9GAMM|nr:exonuclease SbcCD subunit D C-terminal domain-containing protein [Pseudoalteromonas citrea]KAF7764785.1 exonuclease SbcD [Pseudoalteromonas citrea]
MKVLHTSDWHLGQQFYEHSRTQEHDAFLTWLCDTLTEQAIDVLVIAGDIYHTATPPASAEQQLYSFIKRAKESRPNLQVVIIAGNHDSANRIETAKPLLHAFDTHVVGRYNKHAPEEVVLSLKSEKGPLTVVAMPFLRAGDLMLDSQQPDAYQHGVNAAYLSSISHAVSIKQGPLLVMGHLHAKGGDISSDSERNITIGGFDSINASIFTEHADYVALGHLHKSQRVAKSEFIRYSGTPMPMSFSERHYQHQVLIAQFDSQTCTSVTSLLVPRYQDVCLLPEKGSATLDELCELINQLPSKLETPPQYVRLRLNATETDSQFRAKIDEALADKHVRFCGIERVHSNNDDGQQTRFDDLGSVEQLDPVQLLDLAFQQHMGNTERAPEAIKQCLAHVMTTLDEVEQS